jgi:ammonia channel protein AmtB
MGSWYWIGVVAGLGVAVGILAAAIFPNPFFAAAVGAIAGAAIGFGFFGWPEGVGGILGGIAAGVGAAPVVAGSLRRGGTRLGLAGIVALIALGAAALAFIPTVGYLIALIMPFLAIQVRRREPERHAGLRTLARD